MIGRIRDPWAEMSSFDRDGRLPLHYAALADDSGEVRRRISGGDDVNAPDRLGFTPLHLAAQSTAAAAALVLLEAGAHVDSVNNFGNTPLFVAVFNSSGKGDLIEMLRQWGADPMHQNASGQSPVGLARLIGNFDAAKFFADIEQ